MSTARAQASVVVRTLNSASTLAACLESLRCQTVSPEIIVVDSGSSDNTLAIAQRLADRVIELGESFSYGRALNRGATVATAPVHFAVSSHCVIPRRDWIERALGHYDRPDVAGTNGQQTLPDGSPLREVFYQRAGTELPNPYWGFSNHASSWRGDVWSREPFNESLIASEDFEWSDRVLALGFSIAFDPALTVTGHHRTLQGPLALYRRSYREFLGLATFRQVKAPSLRRSVRDWWWEHPPGTKRYRQRLSPYRAAVISGRYVAGREVQKSSGRSHLATSAQRCRVRRARPTSVDILYVASGTTPGHQRADEAVMDALSRLGVRAVLVSGEYSLPDALRRRIWKSLLTVDLFEAMMIRRAAQRGVKRHRPRAIVYATSHAALLQPRRRLRGAVGIRFDTPAQLSRQGRLFSIEHWLERRRFRRVRILLPVGPTVDEAVASILPSGSRVVPVPIPMESPALLPESAREPIVVAYAGQPYKKGLDRIARAWAQVSPGNRQLLVTGIDREAGTRYLREHGISPPDGIEWRGKIRSSEHRALTARAEIYLAASRYEDYGMAQLEALADGALLVTGPSPGPFVALSLAQDLDGRLVASDESPSALAQALHAAFELTDQERATYRQRARSLLGPFAPARVDETLREDVLPVLLPETSRNRDLAWLRPRCSSHDVETTKAIEA